MNDLKIKGNSGKQQEKMPEKLIQVNFSFLIKEICHPYIASFPPEYFKRHDANSKRKKKKSSKYCGHQTISKSLRIPYGFK